MNKTTRRTKQEAVSLLNSRTLSESVAFKFVGWMESHAGFEIKGQGATSVGKALAEFVHANNSEIRDLPLRKTEVE